MITLKLVSDLPVKFDKVDTVFFSDSLIGDLQTTSVTAADLVSLHFLRVIDFNCGSFIRLLTHDSPCLTFLMSGRVTDFFIFLLSTHKQIL